MSNLGVLQEGRARRPRRPHSRRGLRWLGGILATLVLGCVALLAFMASAVSGPTRITVARRLPRPVRAPVRPPSPYGVAPASVRVHPSFRTALRSGVLFDVHTGQVLWSRDPGQPLPIASLTKMMTALVVAAHSRPGARVLITPQAVHFSGSGVGVLPLGRRVPLLPLLYGLLLPSGNDAAIALAQHVGGTRTHFVGLMNRRAGEMGLTCSRFDTPSGIVDQGNYSCGIDLARLAHAVLEQPLLGPIVAARQAVLPFPIKGGKLYLYNNNPLLVTGFPGTDGVKTGYTSAAGRCLVAAVRRGRRWLGVVLLHSADPAGQAMELLNRGFAAENRASL